MRPMRADGSFCGTPAKPAAAQRPLRARREGFTLLEVVLMLALVVVIGSLSWPSLQRPLANQRLSSGAKQVRVALARARLAAMESGEAQQFRILPGGNRYRVGANESLLPSDDTVAASDENRPRLTQGGHKPQRIATTERTQTPERWQEFRLPETVTFAPTDESVVPESAMPPTEELHDQAVADDVDGESWSDPIVFGPDGTAQDASIRLLNERGMQVIVRVRGLTGAASVGPIELQPDEQQVANVESTVRP